MKNHPAIQFPYGRGKMAWSPDPDLDVTLIDKPEPRPQAPDADLVRRALATPLDSPGIRELAAGIQSATIVVTDATRPCPDKLIVMPMLESLERAGVPDANITILVAIGMHRPSSFEEKIEKLGEAIVHRYRVVDSAPTDATLQLDLGHSPDGVPICVDRRAAEADLLLATGIVEPHQYAGFSGGWKTVAIGTAGAETITALHGMRYLEDPAVRLGVTEGNSFLETARWIGQRVGLRFVVNVSLDSSGRIVHALAGHPESVHRELSAWVRERAIVAIDRAYPIVIGAAGHPKDSNLYQATRIPTYLCYGRTPIVEPGGVIIVPAACPEGAGQGGGERLFERMLSTGQRPSEIVELARREGIAAGGQRAVMVAWAQEQATLAFVGTADPELPRRLGFEAFASIADAVRWAGEKTGAHRLLAVPRALTTLPETAGR